MGDYHLHLHRHGPYDGVGPPPGEYPPGLIEAYVAAADARGVTELGFTEHLFRCVESASVLGAFWEREPRQDLAEQAEAFVTEERVLSLEGYVSAVIDAKERGLPVKLGLEVDFFPETIDAVLELVRPYPFDFLIGSVHWVGGWSIDHGDVAYEFERRGVDQAWRDYFDVALAMAESGAVDVLAHIDVVKKFGNRPAAEPLEDYVAVAGAAARSGTAVEINGNGINVPVGELYPSPAFLRQFHSAGVPITFASDAHRAEDAAQHHAEAVELARDIGYRSMVHFTDRVALEVPLP